MTTENSGKSKTEIKRLLGEALKEATLDEHDGSAPMGFVAEQITNALAVLDRLTPSELAGCGSSSDELTKNMEEDEGICSDCKLPWYNHWCPEIIEEPPAIPLVTCPHCGHEHAIAEWDRDAGLTCCKCGRDMDTPPPTEEPDTATTEQLIERGLVCPACGHDKGWHKCELCGCVQRDVRYEHAEEE